MINPRSRLILALIMACLVSILVVAHVAKVQEIKSIEKEAQRFLNTQSINVEEFTGKYGVAAALLARRPDIVDFFLRPQKTHEQISSMLLKTSDLIGANNIWAVDQEGLVLASTLENLEGLDVSGGLYFTIGMEGRLGRATIVQGINARSYVFAAPVFHQSKVIGLLAVQIGLEAIERVWVKEIDPVVAVDKEKRIFLSNVNSWRFKYLTADVGDESKNVLLEKNKSKNKIMTLASNIEWDGGREHLLYYKYLPLLEWDLVLIRPYQPVKNNVKFYTAIWTFLLIFAWLIYWIVYQRGRRRELEKEQQKEFAHLLERKVERRTEELSTANKQLALEVDERKHAEQELRKAQNELIQAAKMALIGQMSTELAHEYNQPISAIKFYAENAEALLEKEEIKEVKNNMSRIVLLTDRMSKLTATLRTFAHKPNKKLKRVNLASVIDEVMVLMRPRALKENVEVKLYSSNKVIYVRAGNIRLAQVMTNLISNALDALKDSCEKKLEIYWQQKNNYAEIIIKDTGAGIDTAIEEKIFDAFYTTKSSGDGLGLGLFIVYNIIRDFHGMLELRKEDGYGTVFLLKIPIDKKS